MNHPLASAAATCVQLMLLLCTAAQAVRLDAAVRRARRTAVRARRFERRPARCRARVLVLGDSTGVGIGADAPAHSVAGLLAADFPDVEVVNRCVAGARVADVLESLRGASWPDRHFDLVLVHAGGNDVLRGTRMAALEADTAALLSLLGRIGRRTVWLSSANVGLAPVFIAPFSWWFSARTRRAFAVVARCAARADAQFVNFVRRRSEDPFSRDAATYFASDRLHPSSASYRHCYARLKREARLAALLTG